MKTKLSILLLSLHLCGTVTQAAFPTAQVVVPNALANVEGNSSVNDVFNSSSFRMQQVFDASQFSFLGNTSFARIDGISFRIDVGSAQNVAYSFSGSTIQLSTTTRSPDNLSPIFAENVGPNAVMIYTGPIALGGLYQPGASPQPFNQLANIVATTPFSFVPSQGNLLLDITAGSGHVFVPGSFDAQSTLGDSMSRVFATSAGATAGTADTLGMIVRIDMTIIPEPRSLEIIMAGITMLMVFRRK